MTTQWKAFFKQDDKELGLFITEIVKPFVESDVEDDKTKDYLLKTVSKTILANNYVDTVVLGELASNKYSNSELKFNFMVDNPIPDSGLLHIKFPSTGIGMIAAGTVASGILPNKVRCFESSCACPEDGLSNNKCIATLVIEGTGLE